MLPAHSSPPGQPPTALHRPSRNRSPPAKRRRTSSPPYSLSSPSPPGASPPSPSSSPSPSPPPPHPPPATTAPGPPSATAKWFRKPSVVWYRGHDLRVEDHPALLAAAQRGGPVVPLFVWDPSDGFGSGLGPVKQWWLRESLSRLEYDLKRLGVQLYTREGHSTDELRNFLAETGADAVFWNRCYEPDLLTRDEDLRVELGHEGLTAESFKAELLVEPWELSNTDVSPCFDTFHGYMREWMTVPPPPQPFPCPSRLQPITRAVMSIGIGSLGLEIPTKTHDYMSKIWIPGSKQAKVQLDKFLHEVFPAFGEGRCRRHFDGTSRLSPHIRFGELSPRRMYHSTRLRVSRWDRASFFQRPYQRRRPGQGKHDPSLQREGPKLAKNGAGENGMVTKKRRKEEPDRPSDVDLDDKLPAANGQSRGHGTDGKDSSNTSKAGKNRSGDPGRHTPKNYKKPGLPHISLSARAFLKNLCLRDFSYHVLFHNPDFNSKPLIPEFASFPWAEDNGSFESWRSGKTGYPIVDAAMRELEETGWIHNGMRFLVACFLTKYLLLPWSRGLKEFYKLLIDGDRSSNALGWQWTAGSNTDAFPVSCLVNPVKVAYRHDPSGSYVRRWLPELAKLPTEFVHQPWKAPPELLKSSGVELGKTYPNRIVQVGEARTRALKAMRIMKRIFSGMSVLRGILDVKDEDIIKEWPKEEPEVLQVDDTAALSGKMSLLPSLWALLQCDQQSTFLSSASSGSDPLIAMDTASLAEGALAVPMGDQHESIEHALITAHEQTPASAMLSASTDIVALGADVEVASFANENSSEAQGILHGQSGVLGVDQLEHQMKYEPTVLTNPPEAPKLPSEPLSTGIEGQQHSDQSRAKEKPASGQAQTQFPSYLGPHALSSLPLGIGGSHAHYPQPQPQQQFQSFQQLQQLRQFHQLQQFNLQQQQQQQHQAQHTSHPTHPQHQQTQPATQQAPQPPQPPQQPQPAQPAPPPQQQQHAHIHSVIDSMYASGANGTNGAVNTVAGVPVAAPPVVVGPSSSAADASISPAFQGTDGASGMYAHQFGMGQFYGFHHVLPVVNPHSLGNSERGEVTPGSAAPNAAKLAMSGMLPVGYGMYGTGMFDPSVLSNALPQNGSYGNIPMSSQPQAHAGAQNPYGLPPHPMYFGAAQASEMLHAQAAAGIPQHSAIQGTTKIGPPGARTAPPANSVTVAAAAAAAVAAGGREVEINVASDSQTRTALKTVQPAEFVAGDGESNVRQFPAPAQGDAMQTTSLHSPDGRSRGAKPVQGKTTRSGPKAKGPGRNRRNASQSAGRSRGESRAQASPRSRGHGRVSASQRRSGAETSQQCTTSLKSRQEMLAAILAKEDHEYHGFAHYLSVTYELTGNTDRHTSKDYIRLCNLKDDYHKQCTSEKDKLKIYRIKAFFSKILKLEVTGEWDRHNHGGVRGPYVYGIRTRKAAEQARSAPSV